MSTTDEASLVRKEDNSLITNFLTICASSFFYSEKITQKEIDSLSIALCDIGVSADRRKSLLLKLAKDQNEFLSLLLFRYGSKRLAHNLFTYTVTPVLRKIQNNIFQFAQSFLQRSELYLNRYIKIYDSGQYIEDELALKFIVRFSEKLKEISSRWTHIDQNLLKFFGNTYDSHIDQKIFSQLDIISYEEEIPRGSTIEIFSREINSLFYEFLLVVSDVNYQFSRNYLIDAPVDTWIGLQSLKALTNKLFYPAPSNEFIEFSLSQRLEFQSFTNLEIMRIEYVDSLYEIQEELNNWLLVVKQNLRALPLSPSDADSLQSFELSYELKQLLLFDMVVSGSPSSDAERALERLQHYFRNHRVLPTHILIGELSRIDPHLDSKTLEILKGYCFQSQSRGAFGDQSVGLKPQNKSDYLNKSRELAQYFADKISKLTTYTAIALIFLCVRPLTGCGLKLNPQSDIPALRPEIQYKEMPTTNSKQNSLQSGLKHLNVKDHETTKEQHKDTSQKP
jgi:hypothetical protein